MAQCHEFIAFKFYFRVVALKISLHHVFGEMVMPCRHRRMCGKDGIDCNIFKRGCEIQTVIVHLLAYPFQHQECRVPFVDMPNGRFQSQHLQRTHTADTQYDLLFHTHDFVTTIQAVRDVSVMRTIVCQVSIQQVKHDMTYFGLPNLEIELASGQLHKSVGFGSIGKFGRNDGQIFKMRIGVGGDLVAFPVYGLMKIALTIEQTDADEWQAQIARCLAVIARQNAQAARIDRETFMKSEFGTKICDQVILAQPV